MTVTYWQSILTWAIFYFCKLHLQVDSDYYQQFMNDENEQSEMN